MKTGFALACGRGNLGTCMSCRRASNARVWCGSILPMRVVRRAKGWHGATMRRELCSTRHGLRPVAAFLTRLHPIHPDARNYTRTFGMQLKVKEAFLPSGKLLMN